MIFALPLNYEGKRVKALLFRHTEVWEPESPKRNSTKLSPARRGRKAKVSTNLQREVQQDLPLVALYAQKKFSVNSLYSVEGDGTFWLFTVG